MSSKKKPLSEKVAKQITDMITIEKRFLSGDKLPNENILAHELGISRTTLREAIKYLTARNILEIKRGRGTFVTENPTAFDDFGMDSLENIKIKLKDLYEIRLMIEPQITYLAAKRASDEELERIIYYGNETEKKILNNEDRTESDRAFHGEIAKAAHNDWIKRLMPILNNAISTAVKATHIHPEILEHTLKDHRTVVEFLKERDAEGAELAMRLHISRVIKAFGLDN